VQAGKPTILVDQVIYQLRL